MYCNLHTNMTPQMPTHNQALLLQIMLCWIPLILFIVLNIVFWRGFLLKKRMDKGLFDNAIATLTIGPTIMVVIIVGFIYFTVKQMIKEKKIKNRAEERLINKQMYSFWMED